MLVGLAIKKDLYRDYLQHVFKLVDNVYHVSRSTDFGRMVCARISYRDKPMAPESTENICTLLLPASDSNRTASSKFLYIKKEDQLKLADEIEAIFNIDFDRYYLQGRKLGMEQKEIIQAFIVSRGLTKLIGNIDMLKKREYREAVNLLAKHNEALLNKARYRNERIENSLREHKQLYCNA